MSITCVQLKNYRNFSNFTAEIDARVINIIGGNGSGKTNILESISLLSPGRGVRRCKFDEIHKVDTSSMGWSSTFVLENQQSCMRLTSEYQQNKNRILQVNGSKISSGELSGLCKITWLTPQMDGLFLGSAGDRRRFLDRTIFLLDAAHAKRMQSYEYYLRERMKILQTNFSDLSWLEVVELKLSEISEEIIKKRREAALLLQGEIQSFADAFFAIDIKIEDGVESDVFAQENIQGWIKQKFYENRKVDQKRHQSHFGPHRADLLFSCVAKNIDVKFCSTGEQKAALITLILAQANIMEQQSDIPKILLLDEVFVHLDEKYRKLLGDYLANLRSQIWITGTEVDHARVFNDRDQKIFL